MERDGLAGFEGDKRSREPRAGGASRSRKRPENGPGASGWSRPADSSTLTRRTHGAAGSECKTINLHCFRAPSLPSPPKQSIKTYPEVMVTRYCLRQTCGDVCEHLRSGQHTARLRGWERQTPFARTCFTEEAPWPQDRRQAGVRHTLPLLNCRPLSLMRRTALSQSLSLCCKQDPGVKLGSGGSVLDLTLALPRPAAPTPACHAPSEPQCLQRCHGTMDTPLPRAAVGSG